jgi:UDP-galactopyranose mutase
MIKKILIIGAGPAGCAAAHQLQLHNISADILIVEKGSFIGGGCKTYYMGGHPYTFGPRHFITEKEYLYNFLDKYVPLRRCQEHEFKTYVEKDDAFYSFPINELDIKNMPDAHEIKSQRESLRSNLGKKVNNLEDYWKNSVGDILYEKFIKHYNKKMWFVKDVKELDTFNWSPKGPPIASGLEKTFSNMYSAYPIKKNGYDDYFDIATKNSKVLLNTKIEKYDLRKKRVKIKGESYKFDIIINTLSPDLVLNYCFGELPFIGRDFYTIVLPIEHAFPKDVYFLYYAGKEKVTRCVEYKKLTHHKSKNTLLGFEIPSLNNRLYPVPIKKYLTQADQYFKEMPEDVYSIGRAGVYRYGIDFDRCIDQAMIVAEDIKYKRGGSGSALQIDPRGERDRKLK